MRQTFLQTLVDLADQDERIVFLTGDLGYLVIEPFAEQFPDRFINVGVAEQNMMGIATGLAEAGFIPFVYSIAPFVTLRSYEFFRNGPIFHHLPVRIIGVGGGYEYGEAGPTHHALEDIAVMRVYPDVFVIAPADYAQAKTALLQTWDRPEPIYYRLGKNDKDIIPDLDGQFELGKVQTIGSGKDILLLSMGSITSEVVKAANQLTQMGIENTIAVIASINPPPVDHLKSLLTNFSQAVTIESHYIVGGIGSLVSEVIAENRIQCQILRLGVESLPDGRSGSMAFMRHKEGLSVDAIVNAVKNF